MPNRKTHHVVPNPKGGWDVKPGGGEKTLKHFERKKDAEDFARQVCQKQNSELIIHSKLGRIQRSDSHPKVSRPRQTHHVVPNPQGGWDVKKGNGKRALRHFEIKSQAEKFALEKSQKAETELVVHGKTGRIQRSSSHGKNAHKPHRKRSSDLGALCDTDNENIPSQPG
jgi:hypothetical protein